MIKANSWLQANPTIRIKTCESFEVLVERQQVNTEVSLRLDYQHMQAYVRCLRCDTVPSYIVVDSYAIQHVIDSYAGQHVVSSYASRHVVSNLSYAGQHVVDSYVSQHVGSYVCQHDSLHVVVMLYCLVSYAPDDDSKLGRSRQNLQR